MATYFVTDEFMLKHKCEWDKTHIERPERLKWILDKLKKSNLLDKCVKLESRSATLEELSMVHSKDYISKIEQTQNMTLDEQEQLCSQFEDIYINENTWKSALLSAGSALELTETILRSNDPLANGFAAIRPPGHHASSDQACGFCVFNNVAICAKKAISMGVKRVLIVDFDVHAGQGTQYCIKDNPNIRLVSIHRYEEGKFWPQLAESAINNEYSNTLNVPLNSIGHEDNDYIAVMSTLILPLIHNWKPELILVSCGFDAGVGDPEGEMLVTSLGFGTMTGLLAAQNIPLALFLEGGYFLETIGESSVAVLNALIEKAPPRVFIDKIGPSSELLNPLLHSLHSYRSMINFDLVECVNLIRQQKGLSAISNFDKIEYKSEREFSLPYPTRDLYSPRETEVEEAFAKKLHQMIVQRRDNDKKQISLTFGKNKKFVEITIGEKSYKLHIEKFVDLLFVYHFILLPLTLKYEFVTNTPQFLYKFEQFTSNFNVPYTPNELLSDKLATEILQLPEDFGFWSS